MNIDKFIITIEKKVKDKEIEIQLISDNEINIWSKDKSYVVKFDIDSRFGKITRTFSVKEDGSERSVFFYEYRTHDNDLIVENFFELARTETEKKKSDISTKENTRFRDFIYG